MTDAAAAHHVRPVRDGDAQDLFGLLALCFAEYPGCFVDPHDDLPDLVRPATTFGDRGVFWVAEDGRGRVCGCLAFDFPQPGTAELHRLYVRPDARRAGLASRLVRMAEEAAVAGGAGRVVLWSDTRFADAHRLYERLGYGATGERRELGDISNSAEFGFAKRLASADR